MSPRSLHGLYILLDLGFLPVLLEMLRWLALLPSLRIVPHVHPVTPTDMSAEVAGLCMAMGDIAEV